MLWRPDISGARLVFIDIYGIFIMSVCDFLHTLKYAF